MKRRKSPELGTVFFVPLRDGGWAVGLLARTDGRGSAFGYFFGPRLSRTDGVDLALLNPERALLVGMFGDLDLVDGNWPVHGRVENWDPKRWCVPAMARVDEKADRAWVSRYDDMLRNISEVEVDLKEAAKHPYDRMMGSGAVEIRLTKLIAESEAGQGA